MAEIGYFEDCYLRCGGTIGFAIKFLAEGLLSLNESAKPNLKPLDKEDAGLTHALVAGVANFLLFFKTTDGGKFYIIWYFAPLLL